MRVPLKWLGEWVDLPDDAELEHQLTQGGLEVESDEDGAPTFDGIVVAHVLERDPHPNADRLSLCKVDAGGEEPLDVVCGAPNVRAGLKVAFAPPGARLPDGTKLKRSKIRGVVSNGMICSARELGLGEDHSGILELDPDVAVGRPFAEVAPRDDRVIEVALTPNRGDCASLLGIAREVRAHFGHALRIPPVAVDEESGVASEAEIEIEVAAAEDCPRYLGRVVRGVEVGPSPEWLRDKLESAGTRSINCIVDVTNLVMLEFGQPLHAFDLRSLRGGRIVVRRASDEEKLVTLDGEARTLGPDDLVIADAERPVALAGVMGGAETEVGETTRDILLEAALFSPTCVRRSARRHGLHTEASYRFERGVDREGLERAIDRAARLIAELAGGEVAPGRSEGLGTPFPPLDPVEISPDRVNRLLGTDLGADAMRSALERLEIPTEVQGEMLRCSIPSYRNDLQIPADLVEEIARIHGYENIEARLPLAQVSPATRPREQTLVDRVRDLVAALGFSECMTLPMESEAAHDALGLAPDDPRRAAVALENPLVDEERLLRTSLVPSLLGVVRQNLARQRSEVRAFEVGRVFAPNPESTDGLPVEALQFALAIAGEGGSLWHDSGDPFFEVKGIADRLFEQCGATARWKPDAQEPFLHPGASARAELAKQPVAVAGELHPDTAARFDIDTPCALLVLHLGPLAERPDTVVRYAPVSRHPSVRRDLALLVDADQPAGALVSMIRQKGGGLLQSAELFDRYEGKGVPPGKVSLGVRLVFQHGERTLTEGEVAKATDRIVRALGQQMGAELR